MNKILLLIAATVALTAALFFFTGYIVAGARVGSTMYEAGFEAGVKDQMAIREKTRLKMDQAGICDYVLSICPLRQSAIDRDADDLAAYYGEDLLYFTLHNGAGRPGRVILQGTHHHDGNESCNGKNNGLRGGIPGDPFKFYEDQPDNKKVK